MHTELIREVTVTQCAVIEIPRAGVEAWVSAGAREDVSPQRRRPITDQEI